MRWITSPGWPGNLLAVVAGALTTLALAPYDIWPLALVALALFYLGLRDLSPRQALGRGWCFGFGLFGAGTSWIYYSIHHFGGASVLLAGLLMLLHSPQPLPGSLPCPPGYGHAGSAATKPRWPTPWHLLRCGSLQEAFRGWFLTGFPWLYSGYSQLDGPLAGLAPLGGMWLISFHLALSCSPAVQSPTVDQGQTQGFSSPQA
jgi:apolipoprotein N-acyltransferase